MYLQFSENEAAALEWALTALLEKTNAQPGAATPIEFTRGMRDFIAGSISTTARATLAAAADSNRALAGQVERNGEDISALHDLVAELERRISGGTP